MPHTEDLIPSQDSKFDGLLAVILAYVKDKTTGASPAWPHIPAAKVAAFETLVSDWHTAYAKTLAPHTPVDTEVKHEARRAAESFVRTFIQQFLKYDPVTDADRTAMNLHNRDKTHTVIGKPTTRALITDLKAVGGFQVEVTFQDETTPESKARPYGFNGCLLNYTYGTEKVTEYEGLGSTILMTHSAFVLTLPPTAEGAFFSCATRWQSERGELGPWSGIQHIAIT
jgi:hypothetical protein